MQPSVGCQPPGRPRAPPPLGPPGPGRADHRRRAGPGRQPGRAGPPGRRVRAGRTWRAALARPLGARPAPTAYLGAFLLRAALWQRVGPQLRLGHALAAIHLALAGNHLLPLRLGEALRVTSVVRRTGLAPSAATASTVVLRTADLLSVLGLALLLAPSLVLGLFGAWGWAIIAALATAGSAGCW